MANILVCDDEKDIVKALEIYLSAEGWNIFKAYDGYEALSILEKEDIQLVLLDIMMPRINGIETLSRIREKSNIPVIFITAKSEDADKILGLNIGADDYIVKPFNPGEVVARVRSNLRRYTSLGAENKNEDIITIRGITLDKKAKKITVDGQELFFTPKEYGILELLMENKGVPFMPEEIYKRVWNEEPVDITKIIAVHISHIRKKIEIDPANPRYLKVVWGRGYKMEAE